MHQLHHTPLHDKHVELGAQMAPFGDWDMPIRYAPGIVQEHLATRKNAGLFDVSHMGRFIIRGKQAVAFLQYVLTNDAAALQVGTSQYTILPNERGGAVDDAYLYRFFEDEYLLIVNAANHETDGEYLQSHRAQFKDVEIEDQTSALGMISLQGPSSQNMLASLAGPGGIPLLKRNALKVITIDGRDVWLARTGYTGEPICFELIAASDRIGKIWDQLLEQGAQPVGLGARDTLRLEACLPLYGHELGLDAEGKEIPIFAVRSSRLGVSFSSNRGDFIGKQSLRKQFDALQKIRERDYSLIKDLPRKILPIALTGKGIARQGNKVFRGEQHVGYVTSGTMVPYWKGYWEDTVFQFADEYGKRAIGLALVNSDLMYQDEIEVDVRGRRIAALIVPSHLGQGGGQH
jgi:aminomethyltransferase